LRIFAKGGRFSHFPTNVVPLYFLASTPGVARYWSLKPNLGAPRAVLARGIFDFGFVPNRAQQRESDDDS
jgi:hypothetical protein